MAHLHLPPADLGYGWPLVLAPISRVVGPAYTQMLPVVILLDVLLLGPVAIVSVYAIASRIGGRLLGYWATLLWVVAPYASVLFFVGRYRGRYEDQVLPQSLGLSALADYPSMIALVVCAALCSPRHRPGSSPTPCSPASCSASRSGSNRQTPYSSSAPSRRSRSHGAGARGSSSPQQSCLQWSP